MLTSIIIPMFNERPSVVDVVGQCLALPMDKEIIVVDNGSTDGSFEAVSDYVDNRGMPAVRLFLCPERGKAMAVRYGIERAAGEAIVLHDADREYDPCFIPMIVGHLAEYDVVHGARITRPYVLRFGQFAANKLLLSLIRRRYRTHLTDIFTGQRGFRRSVLRSLDITARGFDLETELTLRALAAGCRIAEIEVTYRPRTKAEGKKIGLCDFVCILWRFESLSARLPRGTGTRRPIPATTSLSSMRHAFTTLSALSPRDRH